MYSDYPTLVYCIRILYPGECLYSVRCTPYTLCVSPSETGAVDQHSQTAVGSSVDWHPHVLRRDRNGMRAGSPDPNRSAENSE